MAFKHFIIKGLLFSIPMVAVNIDGSQAQTGKALKFEKNNNEAVRAGWQSSQTYTEWTWSLWVKPKNWNTSVRESFISSSEDGSTSKPLNFDIGGDAQGELEHYRGTDGSKVLGYDVSNLSGWHHIALTQETLNSGNKNVKMYLDGELVDSATGPWENMTTDYITMGASKQRFNSNTESRHSNSTMDEVKIWNETRDQQEIQQDMFQPIRNPQSTSGLVAYYPMNESNGPMDTTIQDAAKSTSNPDQGGNNTGKFVNDPEWVNSNSVITDNQNLGAQGNYSFDMAAIWSAYTKDSSGGLTLESSASSLDSSQKLIFAHNQDTGIIEGGANRIDSQLNREWLVDNDLGTSQVELTFDLNGLNIPFANQVDPEDLLIIENDGNGYQVLQNGGNDVTANTVSNDEINFTGVSLTSGNQYTLGKKAQSGSFTRVEKGIKGTVTILSNPNRDHEIPVEIDTKEPGSYEITVLNQKGQIVKRQNRQLIMGNNRLNIPAITEEGLYFLHIQSPSGAHTTRKVLQY